MRIIHIGGHRFNSILFPEVTKEDEFISGVQPPLAAKIQRDLTHYFVPAIEIDEEKDTAKPSPPASPPVGKEQASPDPEEAEPSANTDHGRSDVKKDRDESGSVRSIDCGDDYMMSAADCLSPVT